MKHYKVIALSVGGRNKKIFNAGDIVKESHFQEGRAEELVEQKFLAPHEVTKGDIDDVTKADTVNENPDSNLDDAGTGGESVKSIDDVTKAEIIKDLTDRGVDFDASAKKTTLYAIWIDKK